MGDRAPAGTQWNAGHGRHEDAMAGLAWVAFDKRTTSRPAIRDPTRAAMSVHFGLFGGRQAASEARGRGPLGGP